MVKFDQNYLSQALSRFKGATQINITQLIHDWQNISRQKQIFFESMMENKADDMKDVSLKYMEKHFKCPVCYEKVESPLHFVFCDKVIDDTESVELH